MEIFGQEELKSVKKQYQDAEDAIKIIEHVHNMGMVTPAVNELRYAGNHILNGLSSPNADSQKEQFIKAERHCQRAIYDAIEVGILDSFAVFDVFEDDYRLVVKSKICPEYNDVQDQVEVARNFVKEAEKGNKEDYYKGLQAQYEPLKTAIDKLNRRRPDLNLQMASNRKKAVYAVAILILSLLTFTASLKAPAENGGEDVLNGCLQGVAIVKPGINVSEAIQLCEKPANSSEKNNNKRVEIKADKTKETPK